MYCIPRLPKARPPRRASESLTCGHFTKAFRISMPVVGVFRSPDHPITRDHPIFDAVVIESRNHRPFNPVQPVAKLDAESSSPGPASDSSEEPVRWPERGRTIRIACILSTKVNRYCRKDVPDLCEWCKSSLLQPAQILSGKFLPT